MHHVQTDLKRCIMFKLISRDASCSNLSQEMHHVQTDLKRCIMFKLISRFASCSNWSQDLRHVRTDLKRCITFKLSSRDAPCLNWSQDLRHVRNDLKRCITFKLNSRDAPCLNWYQEMHRIYSGIYFIMESIKAWTQFSTSEITYCSLCWQLALCMYAVLQHRRHRRSVKCWAIKKVVFCPNSRCFLYDHLGLLMAMFLCTH